MRAPIATALVVFPVSLAIALASGCATEEDVNFADPARVTSGVSVSGSSTTTGSSSSGGGGGAGGGVECIPDGACEVSFETDVLGGILDGTGACADSTAQCHGPPPGGAQGGLTWTTGNKQEAYVAILEYLVEGEGPLVVPCNPAASKMLCNLKLETAAGANPFGKCGTSMPLPPGVALTTAQLETVSKWIECGAPNN